VTRRGAEGGGDFGGAAAWRRRRRRRRGGYAVGSPREEEEEENGRMGVSVRAWNLPSFLNCGPFTRPTKEPSWSSRLSPH